MWALIIAIVALLVLAAVKEYAGVEPDEHD